MTFEGWFSKKAFRPIVLISVVLLGFATLTTVSLSERSDELNAAVMEQVAELGSLALYKRDRASLESALNLALLQMHGSEFIVCQNDQVVASYPADYESCSVLSNGFWDEWISIPEKDLSKPAPIFGTFSPDIFLI